MNSREVDRAEREVERSAAQLETAMHHLGDSVGDVFYKLGAPRRAFHRVRADAREYPPLYLIGGGIALAALSAGLFSLQQKACG